VPSHTEMPPGFGPPPPSVAAAPFLSLRGAAVEDAACVKKLGTTRTRVLRGVRSLPEVPRPKRRRMPVPVANRIVSISGNKQRLTKRGPAGDWRARVIAPLPACGGQMITD
jgi:hypothetical protein